MFSCLFRSRPSKSDVILATTKQIHLEIHRMANVLDAINTQLDANEASDAAILKLLDDLKTALDAAIAAGPGTANIQAIVDRLVADKAAIDAGIAKDTPPA